MIQIKPIVSVSERLGCVRQQNNRGPIRRLQKMSPLPRRLELRHGCGLRLGMSAALCHRVNTSHCYLRFTQTCKTNKAAPERPPSRRGPQNRSWLISSKQIQRVCWTVSRKRDIKASSVRTQSSTFLSTFSLLIWRTEVDVLLSIHKHLWWCTRHFMIAFVDTRWVFFFLYVQQISSRLRHESSFKKVLFQCS